jgi:catechol 2,3-dioxygenase-like lactoylglutathione lyase family enzyme
MTTFKVLATNHTSFTVSNLDRTLGFFELVLGFEVTSKAPRDPKAIEQITGVEGGEVMIAYVRGPGHSIELIEYLAPADRDKVVARPCDTGFAHVAYDIDDMDAAVNASAEHGFAPLGTVHVIDSGPDTGSRVVYLRDDDGVTIEFIEKKAPAA